jgi:putative chitobiose transport system substrate-binding protein
MSKFRKLKQHVVLWACLGFLLSGLGSCRSAPSPDLDFWTMQLQPQHTNYFNNAIATFEAQNAGNRVRWTDVPWEAMESKILTAVSAKTAPDVVNLNPNFASQLAGRKAWLDLNQAISPEVRSQYLPNIWQASTLNGVSFGIPWYLTTAVTIYNQEILKAAGVDAPPKTYAELADIAQKVKDKFVVIKQLFKLELFKIMLPKGFILFTSDNLIWVFLSVVFLVSISNSNLTF